MNTKQIQLLVLSAGLVSAGIALFTYVESRKKNKLQEDIAILDKQIKQLELSEKMNKHSLSI